MSFQKRRLKKLRDVFSDIESDAFLVTKLPNVQYLSGFSGSAGVLYVTGENAFLITDFRYQEQSKQEVKDIEIIVSNDPFFDVLSDHSLISKGTRVAYEAINITMFQFLKLNEKISGVEWVPTENVIEEISSIKDEKEIKILRKAVDITDKTFEQLCEFIQSGMKEREIAAQLSYLLRVNGGDGDSFDPIVASGPNSALPHAKPSDRRLKKGDLLILDFGALYKGYHADMTRTLIVGPPTERHREIYDIVLKAQEKGISAVKPGITGKELDSVSRDYITQKGYGNFFGHSLGHGIGLEIHAFPRVSQKNETVLRKGMVITIEPGIYLPGFGGIRIEDDVVVENDNGNVLNKASKEFISV